jgi:hypothetical protein
MKNDMRLKITFFKDNTSKEASVSDVTQAQRIT